MRQSRRVTSTSRRIAYVLRHRPESIGITLDPHGWVDVDVLLEALARHGRQVSVGELERLVNSDEKQRYAVQRGRIRANQGHSIPVDLDLAEVAAPPERLFHGTVERVVPVILRDGLHRGARHHVHLSGDVEMARAVGGRRGPPVVLSVDAAAMSRCGLRFWRSANGIWLVDHVPPQYVRRLD